MVDIYCGDFCTLRIFLGKSPKYAFFANLQKMVFFPFLKKKWKKFLFLEKKRPNFFTKKQRFSPADFKFLKKTLFQKSAVFWPFLFFLKNCVFFTFVRRSGEKSEKNAKVLLRVTVSSINPVAKKVCFVFFVFFCVFWVSEKRLKKNAKKINFFKSFVRRSGEKNEKKVKKK